MKTKSIKFLAILSVSVLAAGCIEETFPEGSTQVEEQVSNSEFAFDGLLNSMPIQMTAAGVAGYFGQNFQIDYGIPAIHLMTENMLEDLAIQGETGYNPFIYYFANRFQSDSYTYSGYFWKCYYIWIKAANDIIGAGGEKPADNIKPAVGQAYAYRAMYYLDLARLFEPKENRYTTIPDNIKKLTVPIVTEKTTEEESRNNPRATRETMYEFILQDLAKAEAYLTGTTSDYKSPSLGAVYGLMARAYLEMGYWTEGEGNAEAFKNAAEYARKAISASGKTPLTQTQWEDPVNGFNNGSANNSWVWGLTLSSSQTNNLGNFTAMFSSEALWGYPSLYNPSASVRFYERIEDDDFRKHSWLDPNWPGLNEPGEGTPYEYDYKLAGNSSTQDVFLHGDGSSVMPAVGYQSIKFRPAGGEMNNYTVGSCADHPLMRVEEMYFIEMEATAHSDLAGARKLLNDFMNTYRGTKDYSCEDNGANDLDSYLDEMLFQKRVEFWGEGILIFDYKRLDKGITRNYDGTNQPELYAFNTNGRSSQWNIVIPRTEYQSNTALVGFNNPDPTQTLTNDKNIIDE